MAMTYDGTGGLFTRIGAMVYFMNQVRLHQANMKSYLANVQAEYSSTDAYMIDQLNGMIEQRIADAGNILNDIRASSERTIIEMCWAQAQTSTNNPMPEKDIQNALTWLIRQMDADSKTIERNVITVTSSGSKAANNGNGAFVYLTTPPSMITSNASDWPNIRKEIMEVRCIADAQSGAISPGSERFRVSGGLAYPMFDYRSPGGSGVRMEIDAICSAVDDGIRGQNILTNSDLEDWTSNVPDQFTVSSGTAGTDFIKESTTVARPTYGMKCAATGTTFKIRQQLGSSSGTLGKLLPDTPYTLGALFRKDAGATGTLRIALENSAGTEITNAIITPIVASMSSTTWQVQSAEFRTPKILPTTVYLSVGSTVGVATAAAYVDEIFCAELQPIAPGGQAVAVISGSSNWTIDDQLYKVFSNDAGGGFATGLDILLEMFNRGLTLPTAISGSETISDSLIA
jgi:hypothetical protein